MTDLTHDDLKKDLEKLSDKIDVLTNEVHAIQRELVAATKVHSAKIAQHDKDIQHAFDDISKLEDRSWRTGGAILLGTISFIGTAALAILTMLL